MAGRCCRCCSGVPWRMMVGPTQLTPMYWAPRGSWCAHISSRTAVCSQGDAPLPAPLLGPGHAKQATLGESTAERLGDGQVGRIVGEGTEEVGRDVLVDQLAQLAAQRGDILAHVEVHRRRSVAAGLVSPRWTASRSRRRDASSRAGKGPGGLVVDLAVRQPRHLVDEADVAAGPCTRQPRRAQRRSRRRQQAPRPGSGTTSAATAWPKRSSRNAQHKAVVDVRQRSDRLLDLAGYTFSPPVLIVVTPRPSSVTLPSGSIRPKIAGHRVPLLTDVEERHPGLLGIAVVPGRRGRAREHSDLAGRQLSPFRGEHLEARSGIEVRCRHVIPAPHLTQPVRNSLGRAARNRGASRRGCGRASAL